MIEAEKEKEGQHPRSIAQIRRANEPNEEKHAYVQEAGTGDCNHSHPTSLENLCSSIESSTHINVICSWTSGCDDSIVGQHHLRQLAVRPELQCQGCPVLISSKHDTSFLHDFSCGPLVSCCIQRILLCVLLF